MKDRQVRMRVTLQATQPVYFPVAERKTGDVYEAYVSAHGDLTISKWNIGDPFELRHSVAMFAAGIWARVDYVAPDGLAAYPSDQHRAECDCREFYGGECLWPKCSN